MPLNEIFQKIRRLFIGKPIKYIPVRFELEEDKKGEHLVKIFWKTNGKWEKIANVSKLFNYGFKIENEDGIYILDPQVQQILLALYSLNPKIQKDGSLKFEITPPVLEYLREKEEVKEGEKSKKLEIVKDKKIKRAMKIDYLKNKGIQIEFGYELKGEFLPKDAVKPTPDKDYLRIGNKFYLLERKKLTEGMQKVFEQKGINVPLEEIPEFFKKDLVILKSNFSAVLTDEAKKISIIDEPFKPKFTIKRERMGWLEFQIEYNVGPYRIPHDLFLKTQRDYLKLDEYTWVKKDEKKILEIEKELEEIGAKKEKENYKVPIYQCYSFEEFVEKMGGEKVIVEEFKKFLNELEGFKEDRNFDPGEMITRELERHQIKLRPYQRGGIHWLYWLSKNYLHGILADEMGLGKTIQTVVALFLSYESQKIKAPSLIICPKAVINNWETELSKLFPKNLILKYHGPKRNPNILMSNSPIIFITTYETVLNEIEIFSKVPFFWIVVDEATKIKNPFAKRTKAIKHLNGLHRIAITGTPIENNLEELWSIFDFLMPKYLGSHERFLRKFRIPIENGEEEKKKELIKRIKPFIMRRLKKDLEEELPQKIEKKEFCELTPEQKSLYGQIIEKHKEIREALKRGEKINYTSSILPVLVKLKQVCDHPILITGDKGEIEGRSEKFDRFLEIIEEVVEGGNQALLFSQYLKPLDLFERALQKRNFPYGRLDGQTPNPSEIIEEFNKGKTKILLCSLRASSHGINLPAANYVLHFDRWWNPAVEDQATDRAHRIDSEHKFLYIYHLLTKGTLEEKIDKLIEKKRKLAEEIVGLPIVGIKDFSREELIEILTPIS